MSSDRDKAIADRAFLRPDWAGVDFDKTDQAMKLPPPPQEKPFDPDSKLVDLIPKEAWNIRGPSAVEALLSRRSRRKYSDEPMTLAELSFLLYATQGIRKLQEVRSLRAVPSAGSRHPFETYVFAPRVSGLESGLYRYLPIEGKLRLERADGGGMAEELDGAVLGQLYGSAAFFLWTAIPYRTEWRYTSASAKVIALDAGHVCQNLYIACEAAGCGCCAIGAYDQGKADAFLGVDGSDEFAIYMASCGKAIEGGGA